MSAGQEGTVRLSVHPAALHDRTASALENATAGILAIEANGTVLTEGVPSAVWNSNPAH